MRREETQDTKSKKKGWERHLSSLSLLTEEKASAQGGSETIKKDKDYDAKRKLCCLECFCLVLCISKPGTDEPCLSMHILVNK